MPLFLLEPDEKPHPVGWDHMTDHWWQFVCIHLLDIMVMVLLT